MVRIPTHRKPTHPGEMLTEEFLQPMGITDQELSEAIYIPHQHLEDIVSARTSLTPSVALRLAKYFGTSTDFWMNLQLRWDLYHIQQLESSTLEAIKPRQSA